MLRSMNIRYHAIGADRFCVSLYVVAFDFSL